MNKIRMRACIVLCACVENSGHEPVKNPRTKKVRLGTSDSKGREGGGAEEGHGDRSERG